MLEVDDLKKRFGGIAASDGVSLKVRQGEVHALIGPNGAGKTTLIAQLSGSIAADEGRILFRGRDVTHEVQHARVKSGLVRSYQITSIFARFSVLDNLALAVQARTGSSFSLWRPVAAERALFDEARAVAAEVGLAGKEDVPAAELAHGEQRALELGLALATRPQMLLLDEPTAGMGPEESQRMVEIVDRLRGRLTVLLVEHDMDAVFRLADRISVLVNGRVIATDEPQRIRANPEVRRAYLGEEFATA
jgi:branched-chain amino acid transport system ATP-binding protein